MSKPASNDHPIHTLLKQRWSPRAFANRSITTEQVLSLFEAARWAASSYNAQPWSFIVARREDEALFKRVFDCLASGNQMWAGGAAALAISIAAVKDDKGRTNRVALHDVGLAVGNLVTQATSMGLYVHQMAGFDQEQARAEFGIPEGREPVAVIAVGYLGAADSLPEDLQARERQERTRRPLNEFVFGERWGETSSLVDD